MAEDEETKRKEATCAMVNAHIVACKEEVMEACPVSPRRGSVRLVPHHEARTSSLSLIMRLVVVPHHETRLIMRLVPHHEAAAGFEPRRHGAGGKVLFPSDEDISSSLSTKPSQHYDKALDTSHHH